MMYLYADDAKIFGYDSTQVQNCINKMVSWMENYQLTLSPAKCQYLPISHKPYNINHALEYHINCYNTVNIPKTFSVCDLGVVISSDLKWNNHISKIVAKAFIGLYHISHSFNSNNIWILLKAYTTYVRPKLEYNTSIWSLYLIKDIAKIESIQKQFTRYLCIWCKMPFSSYHDHLNKLNIKSLEYRRVVIILTYKICYKLIDLRFDEFFIKCNNNSSYNLRRHSFNIKPLHCANTNSYNHFFTHRVPKTWNKLRENIISAPNFMLFKQ